MNNNTFSRWKESLHLKILSGYLILGLLVLGIITAVWYEKQVFEQAEAEERSLLMQRTAASETYRGLITLFLDNDRAMLWDDSDMDTYDRRESHTMEVIDRLKGYYGEPAQTARIDTVVRLLHEKRRLIERMVDMPIHGIPHGQPAGTPPARTGADGIGTDNDSDGTHRTGRGKETGRAVRPVPQEKERRTGTHDHTGEHDTKYAAHCGDAAV